VHEYGLQDSDRFTDCLLELDRLVRQVRASHQVFPEEQDPKPLAASLCLEKQAFNELQLFQLHSQLLAHRNLLAGSANPESLLRSSAALTHHQWKAEHERVLQETAAVVSPHQALLLRKKTFPAAYEALLGSNSALIESKKNLTVESSLETIYDFEAIQADARIKHLEALLKTDIFTQATRLRFEAELALLRVMPLYHPIKDEILGGLWEAPCRSPRPPQELYYFDRRHYRREKPRPLEPDKLDSHAKHEQAKKQALKQRELLAKVFEYNNDFFDYHKWKMRTVKRRLHNVKLRQEWLLKKDQKDKDKEERDRIEAFRDKKFDIYTDMLKKAKTERIIQILEETDNFLKELACKVIDIKRKSNPNFQVDEEVSEWLSKKNQEFDLDKSTLMNENYTKFYYDITHTNVEKVVNKPSLLEGGELKKYQQIGLNWMVSLYNNKLNGILADEMGLGKTIQTIALLCYVMEFKQNYGPFLVVVPLTTISNWVMEFSKWAPNITKVIFKGNPLQRKQLAYKLKNSKWNVCITTYEYVLKDKSELNKFHWQYIIIDEGHKMKNPKSKFAQTLGQLYNSEYRLLLTGTPLQNNLPELWSLLNFLLPEVFHSCDDFEKWFKMPLRKLGSNEKDVELTEENKLLLIHRFHQVLRPFLLRREKREVEAELPNKVEFLIKVELSGWQKIIYNQINERQYLALDPSLGKVGKKALMNMMMQKRKICDHPYLFLDGSFDIDENLIRASGKFELLDRILPKLIIAGHRILLFTQMTRLMDIFELFFEFRRIRYLRLDGTTKHEDRVDRIEQFNRFESDYSVFILSTRAGGLGLNLQTADTVIFVDSDWNPQMDRQAQDRAHRIGQKKEVRVFRLVTNTDTEEAILSKACLKKNLDDVVIQAGLFNQLSTEDERRDRIEEMIKRQDAGEEEEDSDIPGDTEINAMLARNDAEVDLYAQMDRDRYAADRLRYPDLESNPQYRLMHEEEVPEWIKMPLVPSPHPRTTPTKNSASSASGGPKP